MRVLRPLRLISRNAGMKLIITSLFKAMPAVTNVFGVIFALQLVFVILGMRRPSIASPTFGTLALTPPTPTPTLTQACSSSLASSAAATTRPSSPKPSARTRPPRSPSGARSATS